MSLFKKHDFEACGIDKVSDGYPSNHWKSSKNGKIRQNRQKTRKSAKKPEKTRKMPKIPKNAEKRRFLKSAKKRVNFFFRKMQLFGKKSSVSRPKVKNGLFGGSGYRSIFGGSKMGYGEKKSQKPRFRTRFPQNSPESAKKKGFAGRVHGV